MEESNSPHVRSHWKLTLAYDGTEFHGWQVQPGSATIQGTLADAIATVTGERVLPQGSGRTDAGVHAWGQVASFSLACSIPADNLQRALNRILPAAIRILSAEQMEPGFHARHNAWGKIYQYRIFQGELCPPFLARYVTCSRWPLDLAAMQQAAAAILGEHDFTSFAASDPDRTTRAESSEISDEPGDADPAAKSASSPPQPALSPTLCNVRRIEQSQWTREPLALSSPATLAAVPGTVDNVQPASEPANGAAEILVYTIRGNGFLHHMVRNLVGTFLEIGRGRLAPTDIHRILEGRNRALAGPTAHANGLYLIKVLY